MMWERSAQRARVVACAPRERKRKKERAKSILNEERTTHEHNAVAPDRSWTPVRAAPGLQRAGLGRSRTGG